METILHNSIIFAYFDSYPTYEAWKLGTRRGDYTKVIDSYPTYEAWKPRKWKITMGGYGNSYPTYEAWKHVILKYLMQIPSTHSYPTYEAWKQLKTQR